MVYIPENKKFETLEVSTSSGELTADQLIAQTAVISDNVLQLPMEIGSIGLYTGREYLLDGSSSVITGASQEFHPGSMQINPYQAYEKLPILVTLSPAS